MQGLCLDTSGNIQGRTCGQDCLVKSLHWEVVVESEPKNIGEQSGKTFETRQHPCNKGDLVIVLDIRNVLE